jgi:DNA-binding CsgD family transcriptional regulator
MYRLIAITFINLCINPLRMAKTKFRLSQPERRGRPKKKPINVEGVHGVLYVMNPHTFITIPQECKTQIAEMYRTGKLARPMPNKEYEDIFYLSLAQKEIITVKKWMDFLHGGGGKLLNTPENQAIALKTLGLPSNAGFVLDALSTCEIQRWYEMYYVGMIMANGRCRTNWTCYDPEVVNQISAKYGLVNIPCATDNIVDIPEAVPEAPRRRGSRPGEPRTKIDVKQIEELRLSLMKCKSPIAISKELGVSNPTVYNAMRPNMFIGEMELKKTMPLHVETVKRLIANGDTTWEYYVRLHALCEKALMKAVYASDPEFVSKYKVTPTRLTLLFEYNKLNGSALRVSQAFGVPQNVADGWLRAYSIGEPVSVPKKVYAPGERKGGVVDEDIYARLGLDPGYDPQRSERDILKRGDMLR